MAKFGQFKFSEAQFGSKYVLSITRNRSYRTKALGLAVRKQINHELIFRVRTGDNFYGTPLGRPIQDKYNYFVPSSINNVQSEPQRRQWAAAVDKWKFDLTDIEKDEYNIRAHRNKRMSGYNLFMREAMKGLIDMFVDRGDPAAFDYVKTDLTIDGAWHDMDLSALIAVGAKAVLLRGSVEGNAVDWKIFFRKKGNSNEINGCAMETIRANVPRCRTMICAVDAERVLQYKADNQAWTTLDITIRGWWT